MSAEDLIRGLDLPVTIAGCGLVPAPDGMFDIRSRGRSPEDTERASKPTVTRRGS
jgi:hypothetical protein